MSSGRLHIQGMAGRLICCAVPGTVRHALRRTPRKVLQAPVERRLQRDLDASQHRLEQLVRRRLLRGGWSKVNWAVSNRVVSTGPAYPPNFDRLGPDFDGFGPVLQSICTSGRRSGVREQPRWIRPRFIFLRNTRRTLKLQLLRGSCETHRRPKRGQSAARPTLGSAIELPH